MRQQKKTAPKFAVCINNADYPASSLGAPNKSPKATRSAKKEINRDGQDEEKHLLIYSLAHLFIESMSK
jgi:hypothetical protein